MTAGNIKAWGRGALIGLAVFLGVMAMVAGVFRLAQGERDFERGRWEARLRAAAAGPAARAEAWLKDTGQNAQAVAANPTVQIYLSQLADAGFDPAAVADGEAKAAFLASYMASLGAQGPFAGQGGLAVLDARLRLVSATPGYNPPAALVARLIAARKGGAAGPLTVVSGKAASSAFLYPVSPLQLAGPARAVGYVVAERRLEPAFWSPPPALAPEGGGESLVAPGPDGAPVLLGSAAGPAASPALAVAGGEARSAAAPQRLRDGRDLRGAPSLLLGIPVPGSPWTLVETIPVKTALAGVEEHTRNLVLLLLAAVVAIVAAALALWRRHRELVAAERARTQERSVKLYRGVTELLLQAIDLREPGAAVHSRRVAALARRMAVEDGADGDEADCAELAGALLNVGKLFVPETLLLKAGPLDADERRQLDEGNARWLAVLEQMPFDLPLARILAAAQQLRRLSPAADTPRAARIVVAANAFVALTSPRAYRPARSPGEVFAELSASNPSLSPEILQVLRRASGHA
jgi:hypothetical protein